MIPESAHPTLTFCPYLRLPGAYEFADFWIGPIERFEGSWEPPALREAAQTLLSGFVTVDGHPVERPTLVASRAGGVDGLAPTHREALETAIAFGALVKNPTHPIDANDAWKVVTADNCDLWCQPVDLKESRLSLQRGSRVRTLAGGYQFSEQGFRVPPPLELHWHGSGSFDPEVAEAVYRVLSAPESTKDSELARRLGQAIRWWVKAWRNSASLSWEDRIVQLRIAVDALVGSDKTRKAIAWLNALFASVEDDGVGLLWAEGKGELPRTWGSPPTTESVPVFDHWFWDFADTRNSIVHSGAATSLEYRQPGSVFSGMLVDVADRVVSEAILVSLHRCGYEHLWKSVGWRAITRRMSTPEPSSVPIYTAYATPQLNVWHITFESVDGLEVDLATLIDAEELLSPLISERLGVDVTAPQVYVIPML